MTAQILRLLSNQIQDEGGDRVILDRIVAGETVEDIADDYNISRAVLYKWRKQSPERIAAWDQAMLDSADAVVDDAHHIMSQPAETLLPNEVRSRKERADFLLKLAKLRNQKKYGHQSSNNLEVNFNTGGLHLKALREAGSMEKYGKTLPPAQEAEIVDDDSDHVVIEEVVNDGEGDAEDPGSRQGNRGSGDVPGADEAPGERQLGGVGSGADEDESEEGDLDWMEALDELM